MRFFLHPAVEAVGEESVFALGRVGEDDLFGGVPECSQELGALAEPFLAELGDDGLKADGCFFAIVLLH